MSEGLVVLNAGSSSLKLALHARPAPHADIEAGALEPLLYAHVENIGVENIGHEPRLSVRDGAGNPVDANVLKGTETRHAEVLDRIMPWLDGWDSGVSLAAAGHRVVHGGPKHAESLRLDGEILAELDALTPLAPLHQPHNLAPIRALWARAPDLPQVACFDTAFHRTQPEVAQRFALDRTLMETEGLRRYGFHGLSYDYIAEQLPAVAGPAAEGRVVVAHLGHGASMCALKRRVSMASTMGFTALDGLPMGRRCGDLDPGVMLYLLEQKGWTPAQVSDLLYRRSGLQGVSGLSDDMALLLDCDRPEAWEAVDLFCYRAGRELGSLAAALGGLDVLVFTAGIGEHAAPVRRRICEDAAWLGVRLDTEANAAHARRISADTSAVAVYVIPTDEEAVIARDTARLCFAEDTGAEEGDSL